MLLGILVKFIIIGPHVQSFHFPEILYFRFFQHRIEMFKIMRNGSKSCVLFKNNKILKLLQAPAQTHFTNVFRYTVQRSPTNFLCMKGALLKPFHTGSKDHRNQCVLLQMLVLHIFQANISSNCKIVEREP